MGARGPRRRASQPSTPRGSSALLGGLGTVRNPRMGAAPSPKAACPAPSGSDVGPWPGWSRRPDLGEPSLGALGSRGVVGGVHSQGLQAGGTSEVWELLDVRGAVQGTGGRAPLTGGQGQHPGPPRPTTTDWRARSASGGPRRTTSDPRPSGLGGGRRPGGQVSSVQPGLGEARGTHPVSEQQPACFWGSSGCGGCSLELGSGSPQGSLLGPSTLGTPAQGPYGPQGTEARQGARCPTQRSPGLAPKREGLGPSAGLRGEAGDAQTRGGPGLLCTQYPEGGSLKSHRWGVWGSGQGSGATRAGPRLGDRGGGANSQGVQPRQVPER